MSESEKSSGSVISSEASSELSSEESSSLWSSMIESSEESSSLSSSMIESSEESAVGSSGLSSGEDSSIWISDPSSSGSSSSICENCPDFEWEVVSNNTNEWDYDFGGTEIWLHIQASGTGELDEEGNLFPGDCGGTNNAPQSGTATATVTVPAGKIMTFDWDLYGIVEAEDSGYDTAWFSINGLEQARIDSQGSDGGCLPFSPPPSTGTTVLTAGVHTLEVGYDTVDALYHTDDSGVEFFIKNCCIKDAP